MKVSEASGGRELRVVVAEVPGVVRLRILLPEDAQPGSVDVRLTGRDVVVVAQGAGGRELRSRLLRLSQSVVGDGAQADYEPDGSLTVTLRGPTGP